MARNGTVCQSGSSRIAARLAPANPTQAMSTHDERDHRGIRRHIESVSRRRKKWWWAPAAATGCSSKERTGRCADTVPPNLARRGGRSRCGTRSRAGPSSGPPGPRPACPGGRPGSSVAPAGLPGPACGEHADEVVAGPGDTGADGAWRAVADAGGLVVGEVQKLGEHERGPAIRVKPADQVPHADLAGRVWYGRGGVELGADQAVAAALPGAGAQLVHARMAGDGQPPGLGGGVGAVAAQRADRADEGFLAEVTGALAVDQRRAQALNLAVTGLNECL